MITFKRLSQNILAAAAMIIFLTSISAAQESIDGRYDIDDLMKQAEEAFDLSRHDAVLLLDSKYIRLFHDATYNRYFHRIIWIKSESAAVKFGTNIIPFDKANRRFGLKVVRTWRDGEWYDTQPEDLSEKIPDALSGAEDYNTVHELILPHKNVVPPCIIEVSYALEDRTAYQKGEEGLWTFARKLPVVKSQFSFELPSGNLPNLYGPTSVPDPEMVTDDEYGLDKYTWTMGPLQAIAQPYNPDPAMSVPHITWSTWKDWNSFGNMIMNTYAEAMKINDEMKNIVDSLTGDLWTDREKAQAIADFIQDKIKYVDYPIEFWLQFPRPAPLTYESGYGHRLDKAILAATLFEKAGIKTRFVYIGKGYGEIYRAVPSIARMNDIGIWVMGDNLSAYYNPETGRIYGGNDIVYNRAIWLPGFTDNPSVRMASVKEPSQLAIRLDLTYDKVKKAIIGRGLYTADKFFSPYDNMIGLDRETADYLSKVVSSLIKGASLTAFNPRVFDRPDVSMGLHIELDISEIENGDTLNINIDKPYGGVLNSLHENIDLRQSERASNAYLPCKMTQKIEVSFDLDNLEIINHPTDDSLENDAGYFVIRTADDDNTLTFTRTINIKDTLYPPSEWSSLRELLLAEMDESNQVIILKIKNK